MTPPPINIDGTNENYSNVTIDGQDVEQITIDGQDVLSTIPDSDVGHFDATEISGLSDGDTVSSFPDKSTRNNDLSATGDPTYETNQINGNPTVKYDGGDDQHKSGSQFSTTQSQPFVEYIVLQVFDADVYLDGFNNFVQFTDNGSSDWNIFAGSGVSGGTRDNNVHAIKIRWDGVNSFVEVDGTQVASGDAGANGRNGFTIAAAQDDEKNSEMRLGELVSYSGSADPGAIVENSLESKWGVTFN